jgi:hypothetical protein
MSQTSALHDIDPACQNDDCAGRDLTGRDDAFARRIGFELTEPPQPTDLGRLQHREHLIAAGFNQLYRLRHGFPQRRANANRRRSSRL